MNNNDDYPDLTPGHIKQPLDILKQQTAPEVREMMSAITDASSMRHWANSHVEARMIHQVTESAAHKTILRPNPAMLAVDDDAATELLRSELRMMDWHAGVLFQICVARMLQSEDGRFTTNLKHLAQEIGLPARYADDREKNSQTVWRWLRTFASLSVEGTRQGWITRGRGKKSAEVRICDPLLSVTGITLDGTTLQLESTETPVEVEIVCSRWLNEIRKDSRLLPNFGDVLRVAAISNGKASGAWAQCLAFSLQQRWREDANKRTNHRYTYSRRMLLETPFLAQPPVAELLRGEHRHAVRVLEYWRGAVEILRERGIIAGETAAALLRAPDTNAADWRERWLRKEFNIPPCNTDWSNTITLREQKREAQQDEGCAPAPRRRNTREKTSRRPHSARVNK